MPARRKILFFINDLKGGGAEKVLVNLVNNLSGEKYEITVQVLFDEGVNRQYLKKGVKYKYAFKKSFWANSFFFKCFPPAYLYRKLIRNDYDIAVSFLHRVTARILSGCPDGSTKKILWRHFPITGKRQFACPGFRNLNEARAVYNSFDVVVAVSRTIADSFSIIPGFTKKVLVLYNTHETEHIADLGRQPADVLSSGGVVNLVTVGRLTRFKGYERLLRIMNRLLQENVAGGKFHLYVLGRGAQEKRLRKYITANDLSGHITLLGYLENPYRYVSKADLFVCSSYEEGFSTAVTEALILGTPVVTTLCSGMTEMLGPNNEYGIITANNEEALYQGVKRLLTEPVLLEHYREKAIERGRRFSREETVKAVENLLDSL